ncbi:MAG: YIP1 family protein [Candidatus Lokiarchaeota archaeon]|nr:YIP1 family protein [Candidatus Harpocratesius repetitus]
MPSHFVISILLYALIESIIAFFNGNPGSSGISGLELTGISASFAGFGSSLIGTFVYAIVLALIFRLFKVKPTFIGTLRIWGAVIIWSIIGDLIGLFLPENLSMLTLIFWLLFNIALMIGMVGYTEAKYWQSFLSIVIGFMIIFGFLLLYGTILKLFIS